jgi:hypothetical protein
MAIHNIDMDPVGPDTLYSVYLLAQSRKISRQYGWRNELHVILLATRKVS